MESKQWIQLSVEDVLKNIEDWYMKNGMATVNAIRFDIETKMNYLKIRTVMAMERVLRTQLACDLEIDEKFLEKVKTYVNGRM